MPDDQTKQLLDCLGHLYDAATDVPATFMYTMAFNRGQIGLGAASATIMLATVAAIVVPYLYSELRSSRK